MTFSPLTARIVRTEKRSSRGGRRIERYIIHHTAGGTIDSNLAVLATGPAKKSANYLLPPDGRFIGLVDEEYRAWTSGSASVDGNAVTVETINTSGPPEWRVSAAQLEAHAQMAADLCRRHGWGRVDRTRVRGHRDFAATECPGPYLYPRLGDIIARANQILGTAPSLPGQSTPITQEEDMPFLTISGEHYVVLHGNGGNVAIQYKSEEYKNAVKRWGEPVWLEPKTQDELIKDSRR